MKNSLAVFSISLVSLLLSIAALVLQFGHKDKVAYIDNIKLIEKYKGMEDVRKVFEKKTKQWQSNIDTLAQDFEQGMKKYEKERAAGMSEKERKLSEQLLQNKQQQCVQYRDASQKKLKEEEGKMTSEVLAKLNNIIKEYGKKQNYKIIFGANASGNIVYANNVLDITDQIIEMVNNEYEKNK